MSEDTQLRQMFDRIGLQVVDLETLAIAAGLTPSDSTKMGDIKTALGLADINTVQDAINAAS